VGLAVSPNLLQFFAFWEMTTLCSWALISFHQNERSLRAGFKALLMTSVGGAFFLLAVLVIFVGTDSFDFSALNNLPDGLKSWVWLFLLIAAWAKAAQVPLQTWLPDAMEAPTPISALLSPAMIGIGGYAIVKIVMTVLPSAFVQISLALSVWAVVTMLYGGALALVQDDIKRLLAYSSISQMGYILFGISSFQILGVSGSMFQFVSHGLGKGLLFMVAGTIILQAHGLRSISRMGGLAAKMPITATAALIGFLTIMGIPFTSGFVSEFLIFAGSFNQAFAQASMLRLALSAIAVIATALTAGYSLWAVRRIFFGPLPKELETVREAPWTITVPLLVLSVISFVIGVYPDLVEGLLVPAVKAIVGG